MRHNSALQIVNCSMICQCADIDYTTVEIMTTTEFHILHCVQNVEYTKTMDINYYPVQQ